MKKFKFKKGDRARVIEHSIVESGSIVEIVEDNSEAPWCKIIEGGIKEGKSEHFLIQVAISQYKMELIQPEKPEFVFQWRVGDKYWDKEDRKKKPIMNYLIPEHRWPEIEPRGKKTKTRYAAEKLKHDQKYLRVGDWVEVLPSQKNAGFQYQVAEIGGHDCLRAEVGNYWRHSYSPENVKPIPAPKQIQPEETTMQPTPDTRTEMELTIDNLRELARHAEKWDAARFNMERFRAELMGSEIRWLQRQDPEPECGSSCCLIGIANAQGMNAESEADNWNTYAMELFPAILNLEHNYGTTLNHENFEPLFGGNLKPCLKTRIKGLRKAANMLESKGKINFKKLPG